MITEKNKSKILTKDISCKCTCKFDRKCKSNQKWNNGKMLMRVKQHHICEKDYIWNPATCSCKKGEYLASIIEDSVITCDEIIDLKAKSYDDETKTIPKNFN